MKLLKYFDPKTNRHYKQPTTNENLDVDMQRLYENGATDIRITWI